MTVILSNLRRDSTLTKRIGERLSVVTLIGAQGPRPQTNGVDHLHGSVALGSTHRDHDAALNCQAVSILH